jgi:hypothetical protein
MSIREQHTEVEPEQGPERGSALEAPDSALRKLDVAEGREKRLL